MRDFRLDIDTAGTPSQELGYTGDTVLLEEGTVNLIPSPLTLSTHLFSAVGTPADITDLGSTIANNEARCWFSRTGATGSDYRLFTSADNATTFDTTAYHTITVELKVVQCPTTDTVACYAEGPVLASVPFAQRMIFEYNSATDATSAKNGCTLLVQTTLAFGYKYISVLVPPSFWTDAASTCRFFIMSAWGTIATYEYYYRRPQFEAKSYPTSFVAGTRADRYGIDPATIVAGDCDTIANNLYLSIMVPQGSWFHNPDFGSRLHLLRREKNTERTAYLAHEFCREAVQWLLDSGRATVIDITVQSDRALDPYRLSILVEATQADGMQLSFTLFQEVA